VLGYLQPIYKAGAEQPAHAGMRMSEAAL